MKFTVIIQDDKSCIATNIASITIIKKAFVNKPRWRSNKPEKAYSMENVESNH
jgi:hypothetical protein